MNLGFYLCIVVAPVFLALALIFGIFKERAVKLISGFNMLPKDEQEQYDKVRMARDEKNHFFLWGMIMLIGAIGSLIWAYTALFSWIIWLVLFFREVHLDARKAFEKYKVQ